MQLHLQEIIDHRPTMRLAYVVDHSTPIGFIPNYSRLYTLIEVEAL